MSRRRERILRNLIHEEVDRVLEELDGKTMMEIRLILEREGVVDLLMALWDMRSTAVSRYLGQRLMGGKHLFRSEKSGQGRVWRVVKPEHEKMDTGGDVHGH